MTEVTSDIKVSQQLDYKKSKLMHPTYSMTRVYPITGSTSQTLNTSGGQANTFEIATTPFNLSKSYLTFTAKVLQTRNTGGTEYCNYICRDVKTNATYDKRWC